MVISFGGLGGWSSLGSFKGFKGPKRLSSRVSMGFQGLGLPGFRLPQP